MKAIKRQQNLDRSKLGTRIMQTMWVLVLACFGVLLAQAQPSSGLPPKPTRYFNDYAQVVSPQTAERLNQFLESFEKTDSSQILAVIYPRLPPGAALEDYTIRAASAWKAGQKGKDNGAILFVFIQDRKMRIEVGYGLEGALPDAITKSIIDERIKPYFQRGDYDGGLTAGVTAMVQAARGEYKGTGQTGASRKGNQGGGSVLLFFLILFLILAFSFRRRRGTFYSPGGRGAYWGGWGGGWTGGGWSGGNWGGGGGGGGFSGGGGRFGGGGASGSW